MAEASTLNGANANTAALLNHLLAEWVDAVEIEVAGSLIKVSARVNEEQYLPASCFSLHDAVLMLCAEIPGFDLGDVPDWEGAQDG